MATGKELKLRRVAADVQGQDLAQAMGVSPSRVSQLERITVQVTPEAEARYVAALSKCVTKSTKVAA